MLALTLLSATVLGVVSATTYKEPPPTLDPKPYTVWNKMRIGHSKVGEVRVPFTANDGSADEVFLTRLDLVGDAADRGYAHGYFLAKDIAEFTGPKLDKYFMDEVLNIDISSLPEGLQKIFKVIQVKGAIAAPKVFRAAMQYVWELEKSYVPQYLIDEMDGIGRGICASPFAQSDCNATEWASQVKQLNMLPELIRMACTAYGAWGKATGGKGLTQLRALDFGGGPFANYTVVQVHRGASDSDPFVSVSFPAFVGAITGISSTGVGISEKVWMTYDTPSLQPGSYDGEADVFVLRDILQYSKNRAAAEEYLQNAKRTWSIWAGVGDYETQVFDLVGYQQQAATVYTDVTAPSMTGQPYLENIAYVDKHPQPTHDGPNGSLPTGLTDFYGNISCETNKIIVQNHETGDLHIASYDYTAKQMYVALGRINKDGQYGPEGGDTSAWKAYNRPHLKFTLADLWAGI